MGRILLVDDTRTILEVLKVHLMGRGHEFVTAADGRQALNAAVRTRPDLIISDVMMPHMNGLELCRELKRTRGLESTPFILISSQWTNEKRMEALQLGAVACLDKPVEAEWLCKVVDRLVPATPSSSSGVRKTAGEPPTSRIDRVDDAALHILRNATKR